MIFPQLCIKRHYEWAFSLSNIFFSDYLSYISSAFPCRHHAPPQTIVVNSFSSHIFLNLRIQKQTQHSTHNLKRCNQRREKIFLSGVCVALQAVQLAFWPSSVSGCRPPCPFRRPSSWPLILQLTATRDSSFLGGEHLFVLDEVHKVSANPLLLPVKFLNDCHDILTELNVRFRAVSFANFSRVHIRNVA